MVTVTVDTVLIQDHESIPAAVDGTVVLLSVRTGSYVKFNKVGSEIWKLFSEPRPVGQIFELLSQLHQTDDHIIRRDVIPFLEALISRRLLRIVDQRKAS
jgi:Coenzyme PQQ synthesis protein D (PqqD)